MEGDEKYAVFLREEKYKEDTKISSYCKRHKTKEKTCGPIDYNGRRYKENYETGEIRLYELEEILLNRFNSVARTKRLLNMLLEKNDFDWFCTLTFDNQKINRSDDKEVYKTYVKFINNIKHQFQSLKYITVPERHEDGCIHFHMVLGGVPWQKLGLANSGKVCCHWATKKNGVATPEYYNRTKHLYEQKDTDGLPIYNITSFIYGYTTASRIASREKCASYIKKYVEKDLGSTNIFKKRFYYSANLDTPEIVKRCIGADFITPPNLQVYMQDNPLFEFAKSKEYLEKYNILFGTISNDTKSNLEKGLILTEESTPFDYI
jgi:hypothetical protein